MRVTVNIVIDDSRKSKLLRRWMPALGADRESMPSFDDDVAVRNALVAALATLPKRQREAIALRYLAGLDEDDISRSLQISPSSVRTHVQRGLAALRERLGEIHHATGRKVSLVGWSLGGVYARDLALQSPGMVRSVVTLGSPFAGDVRATNATPLYEALSGESVAGNSELLKAIAGDLPVPATSIYSRTDGIVNWRTCLLHPSDTAENIEVYLASHIGLGVNPAALWAVADRLAQAEGQFRQFDRSGPFAIAYAPPENAQSRSTS